MTVHREGAETRKREITLGGGGQASMWLEATTTKVGLRLQHQTATSSGSSGGGGGWNRCVTTNCLGAALPSSDRCLVHSEPDTRQRYYAWLASNRTQQLLLNGVVVSQAIWDEALGAIATGDARLLNPIFCTGAVFPFQVTLRNQTLSGHMSLVGASFENGLAVSSCQFENGLNLTWVDYDNSPAVLRDCKIDGHLDGSYGLGEKQHVAFLNTTVNGHTRFNGFYGDLRFDECDLRDLDIKNGTFKHLSLKDLNLKGPLDATDAEVSSLRAARATFNGATAIRPLIARYSDFSQATFMSRVHVELNGERATFRHASWPRGGRLDVQDAEVDFQSLVVDAGLVVNGKGTATLVGLPDADAGSLSISGMNLLRCVFRGGRGLEEMSLDSTVTLPKAPHPLRARRRCVADEFAWRARHARWRRRDWRIKGTALEPDDENPSIVVLPDLAAAEVAGVYRAFRKALEGKADEPGASDFYYGEMEMRRVDKRIGWSERFVIYLYWLASGYGLRAWRSLAWLALVVLIGAFVFREFGLASTPSPSTTAGLLAAIESAIPGVPTRGDLTTTGRFTEVSLTVIGPVLLGLAALALRNRVKR